MVVQEVDGVVQVVDSVFYPVKKNSQVTLTIDIGDFQAGGTAYTWETVSVVGTPNFAKCPINPEGTSIAGTILHCSTKVMDIRPETNHTSVTYTLEGGLRPASFPYGVQVAREHGLAVYLISFIFVPQA
jgi:hypothetical protein